MNKTAVREEMRQLRAAEVLDFEEQKRLMELGNILVKYEEEEENIIGEFEMRNENKDKLDKVRFRSNKTNRSAVEESQLDVRNVE